MIVRPRLAAVLALAGTALVVAALVVAAPAQAQMTGKQALEACTRAMLPSPPGYNPPPHEVAASGRCVGIVEAAFQLGRSLPPPLRHCAPADAQSAAQAAVLAWLRSHRERIDEPFVTLAAAALAEKWPC